MTFQPRLTQSHKKSHCLIAESEKMLKILRTVEIVAKSPSSVFIYGESGTGKEVIAHAIHARSPRAASPFIAVNCAAIAAPLLESEFFGHEKGAFTGALQRKPGRFERAHTGTLLLDEISEIPLELQPKLLRAVQEMEFERVGGTHPIQVDVRLISTSNRSMHEMLEKKQFREDLYYRLNVIPLYLPPLRERREDILPLARHFLQKCCTENGYPLKTLAPCAEKKLLGAPWPGNVRELANTIERCVVMAPAETITAEELFIDALLQMPCTLPVGITLEALEKQLILATLAQEGENKVRTAQVLGISLRTLRNKLQSYRRVVGC